MTDSNDRPVTPAPTRCRRRGRYVVMAVLALVIFGSGFVAGAGTAMVAGIKHLQHMRHNPEVVPPRITRRLTRKLDLTDEQAEKVLAIVTERQKALLGIRDKVAPEVMAEFERAYREIADVLDDAQKEEWRELYDTLKARWLPKPPPGDEA